ncbi:hypothetical protein [Sphingobium sp. BYY-5]|nr:hypothetical protein [Sphingobium sp. BYY-5]
MNWPWEEGRGDDRVLPRLHHWMIAALLLTGMMIVMPVFFAFI